MAVLDQVKRVAVDLDGTILEFDWEKFVKEGFCSFGKPKPGAVEALQELKRLGYRIIIHSCRFTPSIYKNRNDTLEKTIKEAKKVFKEYGIVYDELWVKAGKPLADFYIDDSAIEFTTWEHVMIQLLNKI